MSEPTPEPTPEPTNEPAGEPKPSEPAPSKSFTQDDVNALLARQKREQFGDYGDLKTKAAELDELKQSQQSEAERIAARATAAERERDDARAEGLRYKAAATHGISEDYFDLLGTGDQEAIDARGQRLGALIKTASEVEQLRAENEALRAGKPVPTSGRPVEALRPGATPTATQSEDDITYNQLFGS